MTLHANDSGTSGHRGILHRHSDRPTLGGVNLEDIPAQRCMAGLEAAGQIATCGNAMTCPAARQSVRVVADSERRQGGFRLGVRIVSIIPRHFVDHSGEGIQTEGGDISIWEGRQVIIISRLTKYSPHLDAMTRPATNLTTCLLLTLAGCAGVESRTASMPSASVVQRQHANASSPVRTVNFQADTDVESYEPVGDAELLIVPPGEPSLSVTPPDEFEPVSDEVRSYTLADIEQIALGNNHAIAAARAMTGVSSGLYRQVGTRPNPTLGYFGQQLADRNTDQHGVFIEQEFVRGDKLALNQKVLEHTNLAQQMEVETQEYRVLTDVRMRFFEALAAQKQLEATEEFRTVARQGVTVAQERQEAGEGTLVETLQAQTLVSKVSLAAEQADVAFRGASRDLAAIAGLSDERPLRLADDFALPSDSFDREQVYAEIVAESPEVAVAMAIVREKQAILQRQQVQAVPNATGQFGVGRDRGTNNGMINVQISLPLPIHNKNCGNISAAQHDYVRATHEVQRIKQSIRSRLARVSQDFDAALAAVRKYEDEILPQATKSLELSEKAYRAGELEFLQVLILRRSFYDASVKSIQAKGQLAQAAAKVDGLLLTGGLASPQDHTDGDGLRGASFGAQ